MMIPVAGQYEQACNAEDAKRAHIGITATGFDVGQLLQHMHEFVQKDALKHWVLHNELQFPDVVTQVSMKKELQLAGTFQ